MLFVFLLWFSFVSVYVCVFVFVFVYIVVYIFIFLLVLIFSKFILDLKMYSIYEYRDLISVHLRLISIRSLYEATSYIVIVGKWVRWGQRRIRIHSQTGIYIQSIYNIPIYILCVNIRFPFSISSTFLFVFLFLFIFLFKFVILFVEQLLHITR